jgi:hypothetical protein
MIRSELTPPCTGATTLPMQGRANRVGRKGKWFVPLVLASTAAVGGCITVEAPDKPIVIELNVNIRQEVIYRLAEDAGNTIEENKDIF